jgi:hypothetical protein
MSIEDIPDDYLSSIRINYNNAKNQDSSFDDKLEYLKQRKTRNYNFNLQNERIYNPSYSPNAIIDYSVNSQNDSQNNITKNEKNKNFDPYKDFLLDKGLISDNVNIRYNVQYISIDSSLRNLNPRNKILNTYELNNNNINPFSIYGNILSIYVGPSSINDFSSGQKITINNLFEKENTYRISKVTDIPTGNITYKNINLITFIKNKDYVQINLNPNINISEKLFSSIDTSKMFVTISGILGNVDYSPLTSQEINNFNTFNLNEPIYTETSYINNIPIYYLNGPHQIYLLPPDTAYTTTLSDPNNIPTIPPILPNSNIFYIKLPITSNSSLGITEATIDYYNKMDITFTFNHYNTIPVNEINADYPITNNNINGFQTIDSIDTTKNYINIIVNPPIKLSLITNTDLFNFVEFGGIIYISTIKQTINGYLNPASYTIDLGKVYNNIVQVKVVETLFPNTSKNFVADPSPVVNNKLYFQDIENQTLINELIIDEGNYTAQNLIKELEYKFSQITRQTQDNYIDTYNVIVSINEQTNYVSFSSYKKIYLKQPIINTDPNINQLDLTIGIGTYSLVINHPSHGINTVGTKIIINNCIDHLGIYASDINGEHEITNIIDNNRYQIQLSNINLGVNKTITGGGNACYVLVPLPLKFFFSYSDTMGTKLGFRNCGQYSSITDFNTVTTNSDYYYNEKFYNKNKVKSNKVNLINYDYMFMTCQQFPNINISNNIPNVFCKLYNATPGMNINQFTLSPIFYYDSIYEVYELTFAFFDKYGNLYDFNNQDHSFMLEITCIDNTPENTQFNSNLNIKR